MIVVDSSAMVAILEAEPDVPHFAGAAAARDHPLISAASVTQVGLVMIRRRGRIAISDIDTLIQEMNLEIQPVTAFHARLAMEAFAAYGKGRHKAGLNYGDCFSYALAKATGLPLLYKGTGFAITDIASA